MSNANEPAFQWPTAKGDPIKPVWSYGGRNGMYEAAALRAFAHDLVERIKHLELPVREAMKAATGDGLNVIAYCQMLHRRLDGITRERDALLAKLERIAHSTCNHDLLLPNTTCEVDPNNPCRATCRECGHEWRTR